MHKSWTDYYERKIKKHGLEKYFQAKVGKNAPFLELVQLYADKHKDKAVIESGLGTSFFLVYLSKLGYRCAGLDIEQGVIDFGHKILNHFNTRADLYKRDIFSSEFKDEQFSVSFNLGVMEHFSDEEIECIIKEQTRISHYYVFAVPSIKVLRPNSEYFGDERYLSARHWEDLIEKSGVKLVEKRGYRFENKKLFKYLNLIFGLFYHKATFFMYVVKK